MQGQEAVPTVAGHKAHRLVGVFAIAAVVAAAAFLVSASFYAVYPSGGLFVTAQGAALLAFLAAGASFGLWLWGLAVHRQDLRRPLVFVGVVTLGVFVAHLYIVNSPATFVPGSLSGQVGSRVSDSHLSVSSDLFGSTLSVDISNQGSNAISNVTVSIDGRPLPSSALDPLPTQGAPIQPYTSGGQGYPTGTHGVWQVSASGSSVVTVNYDFLTCYHVPDTSDSRGVYGCIMDETYYVPSALGILSGDKCAPYADSCNMEHPPLSKALIAAGMAVFGVNDLGWRIAIIILGTLSIPLLYVLSATLTSNRRLAYTATLLFAADIMFFVHASAALIDVPAVFFSLVGFILYFRRASVWRLNNYVLSGLFLGMATLSKETAAFALLTIVAYEIVLGDSGLKKTFLRVAMVVAPAFLLFAGGLQLYDSLLTHPNTFSTCVGSGSYSGNFIGQIQFMLSYGACLKGGGWTDAVLGRYITPIDWLLYYSPVQYLVTSSNNVVSVGYYGTTNPLVVWEVFIWVPLVAYRLLRTKKPEDVPSTDDRLGGFALVWFLLSYVPYVVLFLYGRVTYPFYIIPAIPAMSVGAAYFVTRDWFPRKMALVYVAAAFVIFFLYFPVKDFLPDWIRIAIGH